MKPTNVQVTAPVRIYLQVSDDPSDRELAFPDDRLNYEITWCQDPVLACEVEYVRADFLQPLIDALQQLVARGIADAPTMEKARAALEKVT